MQEIAPKARARSSGKKISCVNGERKVAHSFLNNNNYKDYYLLDIMLHQKLYAKKYGKKEAA